MNKNDAFGDDEIMSIAEARQLMSETTQDMSDEEVASLLNNLCLLASAFIKVVRKDN